MLKRIIQRTAAFTAAETNCPKIILYLSLPSGSSPLSNSEVLPIPAFQGFLQEYQVGA